MYIYYYVKCSEIEVLNFNKLLSFNFQLAHILQTVTYHNSVLLLCLDGPYLTNSHISQNALPSSIYNSVASF